MSDLELGKKRAEEMGLKPVWLGRISTSHGLMTGEKTFADFDISAYSADDIHRLLGDAKIYWGSKVNGPDSKLDPYNWCADQYSDNTHQCLVMGIRPIKQEQTKPQSMEDVARELIEFIKKHYSEERTIALPKAENPERQLLMEIADAGEKEEIHRFAFLAGKARAMLNFEFLVDRAKTMMDDPE